MYQPSSQMLNFLGTSRPSAGNEFSIDPGPAIPIHPFSQMLIWLEEKSFSYYTEWETIIMVRKANKDQMRVGWETVIDDAASTLKNNMGHYGHQALEPGGKKDFLTFDYRRGNGSVWEEGASFGCELPSPDRLTCSDQSAMKTSVGWQRPWEQSAGESRRPPRHLHPSSTHLILSLVSWKLKQDILLVWDKNLSVPSLITRGLDTIPLPIPHLWIF